MTTDNTVSFETATDTTTTTTETAPETKHTVLGRPSKYGADVVAKCITMIKADAKTSDIMEATGMTAQTVSYYRRRNANGGTPSAGNKQGGDLQNREMSLLSQYDGEIARLQEAIDKAQSRLRETVTKRRRVARALGIDDVETVMDTAQAESVVPVEATDAPTV